jgi:formylglycine-generating enzyme required for sulfatase activity
MRTRRNLARFSLVLAAWLLALLPGALLAQEQPRIALVIGNSTYEGKVWPDLAGEPLQDARTMRRVLKGRSLHFQVVYREDANLKQMNEALAELSALLKKNPGAVALVYFSGHGAQAPAPGDGKQMENYLIPARSELADESDAQYQAIGQKRIETLIRDAGAAAGVIILDACRDHGLASTRGPAARGLTAHASTSIMVMYAAASRKTAYNTPGRTSEFTAALAEEIVRPGPFRQVAYQVRFRVVQATQGEQEPKTLSGLTGTLELVPPPAPPVSGLKPLQSIAAASPGTSFQDCMACPQMVAIPPGSFMMGSPDSEAEGPVHEVRIAYTFAVGKYPVTRGEWRQLVNATGHTNVKACGWENPPEEFVQDDTHPVVCVSWDDATFYTAWLSQKTGHQYRLLSDAEYEYINRAGSTSRYFWGDSESDLCGYANGGWTTFCKPEYPYTSPVGHFKPNRFGLYDTTGNVDEWVQDICHHNYNGAPTDGSAWESGQDGRVARGGAWAWFDHPSLFRAASHVCGVGAGPMVGFRVARDDR